MEQYGPEAREAYLQERERLELDALNVLYVAQTRAIEISGHGEIAQRYTEAARAWQETSP